MKKIVIFLIALLSIITLTAIPVLAKDINFAWDANTESDLAGYRLYQSNTSGSYTYGSGNEVAEIAAGTETVTLTGVTDGTWYWVLTAFDTEGNESLPSNEVSQTVDETAPSAPTTLHFSE